MNLLRSLFGCRHDKLTFPQTDLKTGVMSCSCLACGAEFDYNWDTMEIGGRISAPRPRRFNDGLETKI